MDVKYEHITCQVRNEKAKSEREKEKEIGERKKKMDKKKPNRTWLSRCKEIIDKLIV